MAEIHPDPAPSYDQAEQADYATPSGTKTEWRVCHRRAEAEHPRSWRTQFFANEDNARVAAASAAIQGREVRLQRREVTAWVTVSALVAS